MYGIKTIAAIATTLLIGTAAQASTITTTFAGGNGYAGNMFDVSVGANDLTLEALEVHLDNFASTGVELYMKLGSFVGSENNAAAWTLIDSASVVGAGAGVGTAWDIVDTLLTANTTYGFYFSASSSNVSYTNGTAVGNVAASNADLTIFEGVGKGPNFSGTYTPRVWNGTLEYSQAAPSVVPLPSSLPLLLVGAAGLVLVRRRKG